MHIKTATKWDEFKHIFWFRTLIGIKIRKVATWFGLVFLKVGRRLLYFGWERCNRCGSEPGFNSTISSKKGIRCNSNRYACDVK